jgi:hypothetical protein
VDAPEQHRHRRIPPEKKLTFDQIADHQLADEAVASLGGPVTINACKD